MMDKNKRDEILKQIRDKKATNSNVTKHGERYIGGKVNNAAKGSTGVKKRDKSK